MCGPAGPPCIGFAMLVRTLQGCWLLAAAVLKSSRRREEQREEPATESCLLETCLLYSPLWRIQDACFTNGAGALPHRVVRQELPWRANEMEDAKDAKRPTSGWIVKHSHQKRENRRNAKRDASQQLVLQVPTCSNARSASFRKKAAACYI